MNLSKESPPYARAGGTKRKPQAMRDWPKRYCEALADSGQRGAAARVAGVAMRTVCRRRLSDPEFAQAEKKALSMALELCVDEAYRRAIQGTVEERFRKDGTLLSRRVVYSDVLLLRILEREDPSWRTHSKVAAPANRAPVFNTLAERKAAIAEAILRSQQPLS
jgi:hypothetical protein